MYMIPLTRTLATWQVVEVKGIKFRCYNAGHVLGAAMFLIEIDNMKVRSVCARLSRLVCSRRTSILYDT